MVPSAEDPTISIKKLTPCSPGDPLAIEKSWNEVEATELLEPALTLPDFLRALRNTSPTVREEDIKRHLQFTNESGADGA
jgi:vacuolar protein-sorting-associated protein 4